MWRLPLLEADGRIANSSNVSSTGERMNPMVVGICCVVRELCSAFVICRCYKQGRRGCSRVKLARRTCYDDPLGEAPSIHETATIKGCTLGRWTEIAARAQLVECEIGDYSYIMNDSDLMYSRVGKFVSVASHARVNPSNHPMWRPTLHHFTYRSRQYGFGPDDEEIFSWRKQDAVEIGHDAWLGHGVIVLPGVTVGTGAVIGAGAVVTADVEPYAVMVGVPARRVRFRFAPKVCEALERMAWWDWPHELIGERLEAFRGRDVREFVERYGSQ